MIEKLKKLASKKAQKDVTEYLKKLGENITPSDNFIRSTPVTNCNVSLRKEENAGNKYGYYIIPDLRNRDDEFENIEGRCDSKMSIIETVPGGKTIMITHHEPEADWAEVTLDLDEEVSEFLEKKEQLLRENGLTLDDYLNAVLKFMIGNKETVKEVCVGES